MDSLRLNLIKTLPWKDRQWSSRSKVILLHLCDTWAQFPSSKLHKYPNIFKIISSGNGKLWKLAWQCNMVWPFLPHFLHFIWGHHNVWWSTSHCWQYKQNSSIAIFVKRVLLQELNFLKYFLSIFITCLIFAIEIIESLIFRKLQLMQIRIFFLLTKPHVCFVGKYDNYMKSHTQPIAHFLLQATLSRT